MATKKAAKKTATVTQVVNRVKDIAERTTDINHIDVRLIKIQKDLNPRDYRLPENRAHLNELKGSIFANGVLSPVLVRLASDTKEVILYDGECRVRACLELMEEKGAKANDKGELPNYVVIPTRQLSEKEYPDDASRLLAAVIANQGKPLSKWEQGTAFRRFVNDYGIRPDVIAQKTGYSLQYIEEAIALDKAPLEVKEMLSIQAVTPSLALTTIKKYGEKQAGKVLKEKVQAHKEAGKKGPVKLERKSKAKPEIKGKSSLSPVELAAKKILAASAAEMKEAASENLKYVNVATTLLESLASAFAD